MKAVFLFSAWEWIFSKEPNIDHLKLVDFGRQFLKSINPVQEFRALIRDLRTKPFNFGVNSLEISGRIREKVESVPFSFFAFKSKKENIIKSALDLHFDQSYQGFYKLFTKDPKLFLKIDLMQYDLNEGKTLSISIRNEDWMDINFTSSRNKESFKIRSQLNESKKSKLIVTGNCEYPHRQFSGGLDM